MIIQEDKDCYVIPDKFPIGYGHLLVISKEHYPSILDAPDELVSKMFVVAKNSGLRLKEKLKAEGFIMSTNAGAEAGQMIFHFNVHVIPKYGQKVKNFTPGREIGEEQETELVSKLKS